MNKINKSTIIIFINIILLIGCTKEQDKEIYYETYSMPYQLTEDYSFDCIQVRGMKNQELQDKINNSLTEKLYLLKELGMAEYQWVPEDPVIHLQTSRYLSVEVNTLYVTVDMKTGEIVYLDDLIRLDEEFATTLKNCRILKKESSTFYTEEERTEMENDRQSRRTTYHILALYDGLTKEELYDLENVRAGLSYGHFYLEEGYIVIVDEAKIDISRLDELLLVEKW